MTGTQFLKIGIVGVGKMGTFHARALEKMSEATLIGVYDVNPQQSQKIATDYHCQNFPTLQELFSKVDAVIVATPTESHYEIAKQCILQKKHILIEKPITSTLSQANDLIKLARENKVFIQVGLVERFNAAVVEAQKFIDNPQFITVNRQGPYDTKMATVGVVLDLMIHDIDLICMLVSSEIESIQATGISLFSSHEDIANVRLKFANGTIADLTASRASFERSRQMQIFQQSGHVTIDFMNSQVKNYLFSQNNSNPMNALKVSYPSVAKQQPLVNELQHFIHSIKTNVQPQPSAEQGTRALQIALQILDIIHNEDSNK